MMLSRTLIATAAAALVGSTSILETILEIPLQSALPSSPGFPGHLVSSLVLIYSCCFPPPSGSGLCPEGVHT